MSTSDSTGASPRRTQQSRLVISSGETNDESMSSPSLASAEQTSHQGETTQIAEAANRSLAEDTSHQANPAAGRSETISLASNESTITPFRPRPSELSWVQILRDNPNSLQQGQPRISEASARVRALGDLFQEAHDRRRDRNIIIDPRFAFLPSEHPLLHMYEDLLFEPRPS